MSVPEFNSDILNFLSECEISSSDFFEKTLIFMRLLMEENEKYNLTAIKSEEEFWVKHVCDSAAIFRENRSFFQPDSRICDIGSGAGFPAAIIAMACSSAVYAVESSQKKAEFIRKISAELKLKNLFVLNFRAEDLNKKAEYKQFFDLITTRAVSNLSTIISSSLNMLASSGRYIIYKTPFSAEREIKDAKKKFRNILFQSQSVFYLPMDMGTRLFITAKNIKN